MVQLFRPPTRTNTIRMEGSLRVTYDTSLTTWKSGGVWHSQECPTAETLQAADLYLLGHPQIVSDTLAAELSAAFPDSCTPIEA